MPVNELLWILHFEDPPFHLGNFKFSILTTVLVIHDGYTLCYLLRESSVVKRIIDNL
jgi:hypothetical protein